MKVTIIVLFLFCFVVVSYGLSPVPGIEWEPFPCFRGVKYQKNDCNKCHCSPTGRLICTRKECPGSNPASKTCIVGTAWNRGCNRCWCVKDYGTVCSTYNLTSC